MIVRNWMIAATAVALLGPLPASQAQQQDPKKIAYTDPDDAGPDYELQGEYAGRLYSRDYGYFPWGIQVVAEGDHQFMVVLYPGGLPGAGWIQAKEPSRFHLTADEQGEIVWHAGDGPVAINGKWALFRDHSGRQFGLLHKVHRESPSMGALPPANARVLFDGTNTDSFEGGKIDEAGLLTEGPTTKDPVRDFQMHLEFRTPFMPYARGQARGNSGVYIQRRYEVQVLDSFGLEGVHNECGGLYKTMPPSVNMCLPPLTWQTYDITFTAARFDDAGNKTSNARLTVVQNGVVIHDNIEIPNKTGAGQKEGPDALPILLQNHGNPVRYRNIWIVEGDSPNSSMQSAWIPPGIRQTGGPLRIW